MSMNLEDFGILREDILKGVIDRLYKSIYGDISVEIRREVRNRLGEAIGKKVNEVVETKLSLKVDELLKKEFHQIVVDAKASLSDAITNAVKDITDKHMGIRRK